MRKGLFLFFLLTTALFAFPPLVHAGAFELSVVTGQAVNNCKTGEGCQFETEVSAKNTTARDLYKATISTTDPSHILTFESFDHKLTSNQSQSEEVVQPDKEVKTKVVIHAPKEAGTYQASLNADGQGCNLDPSSPDCYFYGSSKFYFTVNVADTIPVTPTPEVKPSTLSATKPTIVDNLFSFFQSLFGK